MTRVPLPSMTELPIPLLIGKSGRIQLYKLGTTEVLSLPGFIKTPKNSSEEQANLEIK